MSVSRQDNRFLMGDSSSIEYRPPLASHDLSSRVQVDRRSSLSERRPALDSNDSNNSRAKLDLAAAIYVAVAWLLGLIQG